jgi:mannose/cellobiose epimerase-like protein (N-acyl-D-glucosamine 2-epimerase family)
VRLQAGPLVVRRSGAGTAAAGGTPAAFITSNYDPRTWQPVPGSTPNYGHNIEAAWLLADAVAELRARGAVDSAEAERMLGVLQEVGAAAVAAGYDTTHGGW